MDDKLQDAMDRLIRAVIQYEASQLDYVAWLIKGDKRYMEGELAEAAFKEKYEAEEAYAKAFDDYLRWKMEDYLLNRFEDD